MYIKLTEEQKAEKRRQYKKDYYERNKHKQLIYNMRYRHKKFPPNYIKDLELLQNRKAQLIEIFEAQMDILDKNIQTLQSYDPKPEKPKSKKFAVKSEKVVVDFR